MFNIKLKIIRKFELQEIVVNEKKLLKQDLIVDLDDVRFSAGLNQSIQEKKSNPILISLLGDKIKICDFEIGDSASIVGAISQIGGELRFHLSGIRFDNQTYKHAYSDGGMRQPPENYAKSSFEFVLAELHIIRLSEKRFDLVEFVCALSDRIEAAIEFDETCRWRKVCFLKYLFKMISASFEDLPLRNYLLNNGLNIAVLNIWAQQFEKISSSDMTTEIRSVETLYYKFLGWSQLEIERKFIERKFVFFHFNEMRWFDIETPIRFSDMDLLSSLELGFIPDSVDLELSKYKNHKEFEELDFMDRISEKEVVAISSIIENEIEGKEISYEEYIEWREIHGDNSGLFDPLT